MTKGENDLQFVVKENEPMHRFKLSEAVALLAWVVHFAALLLMAAGVINPFGWLTAAILWPLAIALVAGAQVQGKRRGE